MKKLIVLGMLILLLSCNDKNEVITGYLVAKEYHPKHMDNECYKYTSYSSMGVFIPPVVHRTPQLIHEKYIWYIANRSELLKKEVSKYIFNRNKCGEKVSIYKYQ